MNSYTLFFFGAALLIAVLAYPSGEICDPDHEFHCGSHDREGCLPIEWVCDNVKDCDHGKVSLSDPFQMFYKASEFP